MKASLASLLLLLTPALLHSQNASPPNAMIEPTDDSIPFRSGTEGYHTFRIPVLVRAADGSLLAFCEGRADSHRDAGNIDIVMKRSMDEGRTWGALQLVQEEGGKAPVTIGNPVAIVDRESGRIHLLFCRNNERVFYTWSDDHGATWADRREITDSVKKPDWNWIATGPGGGIQLQSGRQAGRLVVACDHTVGEKKRGWPFGAHVMVSDDRGATWRIGAVADGEVRADGQPVGFHSNENAPLEMPTGRADGNSRLYFTFRNQNGQPGETARGEGWSLDGGETYTEPAIRANDAIVSPIAHAAIIHLREKRLGDREDLIVLSAPHHPVEPGQDRVQLSLWLSRDGARTWSDPLLVYDGPSVYSQLIRLKNGDCGILFENGDTDRYERISFRRIPDEALEQRALAGEDEIRAPMAEPAESSASRPALPDSGSRIALMRWSQKVSWNRWRFGVRQPSLARHSLAEAAAAFGRFPLCGARPVAPLPPKAPEGWSTPKAGAWLAGVFGAPTASPAWSWLLRSPTRGHALQCHAVGHG